MLTKRRFVLLVNVTVGAVGPFTVAKKLSESHSYISA